MRQEVKFIGEEHVVPYPFTRTTWTDWDDEGPAAVSSWRPGCETVHEHGEPVYVAEAHGEMILRVVGRFKPNGYPERTFYVRLWRNPDGLLFGKNKLRVMSTGGFSRLARGYRHSYYFDGEYGRVADHLARESVPA